MLFGIFLLDQIKYGQQKLIFSFFDNDGLFIPMVGAN